MLFPSASIIRPADATAYVIDAIIGASKAAAQAPTAFQVANKSGAQGYLTRLRMSTTNFAGTLPGFRLWLFSDISNLAFAGVDGGLFALLKAHAAARLGYVDFNAGIIAAGVNDSAEYFGTPVDAPMPFIADAKGNIYGLLTVRAAYVPAAGETLTMSMVSDQV